MGIKRNFRHKIIRYIKINIKNFFFFNFSYLLNIA